MSSNIEEKCKHILTLIWLHGIDDFFSSSIRVVFILLLCRYCHRSKKKTAQWNRWTSVRDKIRINVDLGRYFCCCCTESLFESPCGKEAVPAVFFLYQEYICQLSEMHVYGFKISSILNITALNHQYETIKKFAHHHHHRRALTHTHIN